MAKVDMLGKGEVLQVRQSSANRGLSLPLGRGVCETKSKMGAPDPENPLFLGFSVHSHRLRPWSRKGADLACGRGRCGDCEKFAKVRMKARAYFQRTPPG